MDTGSPAAPTGSSPAGPTGSLPAPPASPAAPTGSHRPARTAAVEAPQPDPALLAALLATSGVSAAVSDALDRRGLALTVASSTLAPLGGSATAPAAGGRTITLRYLPARLTPTAMVADGGRLMAHRTLFAGASRGDVALIVGPAAGGAASLLGGEAAIVARDAGIAACLLAGDVRDADEILASGLPVWCTRRTPATGRYRIEAAEINGPVEVGGVQVRPGDVAIADASGVAFIPAELFAEIATEILGIRPTS